MNAARYPAATSQRGDVGQVLVRDQGERHLGDFELFPLDEAQQQRQRPLKNL